MQASYTQVYERHMEYQPVPAVGREYAGDPDWFYCGKCCTLTSCQLCWFVCWLKNIHLTALCDAASHR